MRIDSFEWDSKNEEHISSHNISPEEVEEIFIDDPFYRKTLKGKYLAFGQTLDGRYILVVFVFKDKKKIRPVTSRNMTRSEFKTYRKWLGR